MVFVLVAVMWHGTLFPYGTAEEEEDKEEEEEEGEEERRRVTDIKK